MDIRKEIDKKIKENLNFEGFIDYIVWKLTNIIIFHDNVNPFELKAIDLLYQIYKDNQ